MSEPGLSEESAKDPLAMLIFAWGIESGAADVDWTKAMGSAEMKTAELLAATIRRDFLVMKHEDFNFQMQCINNFQTDLKQQIRDEIAVENGTYRERD